MTRRSLFLHSFVRLIWYWANTVEYIIQLKTVFVKPKYDKKINIYLNSMLYFMCFVRPIPY